MAASVTRLREAAREVDVLAKGIAVVPGEVDEVASIILASYQAHDPGFNPYVPNDNFPEGTEEDA
uniref:Uncharacterized protein n=1 Tax=Leersia perrieri TaxID=77586 RepID=A0A0D9VFW6_9ORYZ